VEQLDPLSTLIIRRYYFELDHLTPSKRADRIERETGLTHGEFQRKKDRAVEKLRDDYRAAAQKWRTIPGGKQNPSGGLKLAA
jgi:hypothetical protein